MAIFVLSACGRNDYDYSANQYKTNAPVMLVKTDDSGNASYALLDRKLFDNATQNKIQAGIDSNQFEFKPMSDNQLLNQKPNIKTHTDGPYFHLSDENPLGESGYYYGSYYYPYYYGWYNNYWCNWSYNYSTSWLYAGFSFWLWF